MLDVVRGQSVARKNQVHVTPLHQLLQMLAGAGMNNSRPADNEDPAARPFGFAKFVRNLANNSAFGLFARNIAGHEFEHSGLRGRTLLWNGAHTAVPDAEFVSPTNVAKLPR